MELVREDHIYDADQQLYSTPSSASISPTNGATSEITSGSTDNSRKSILLSASPVPSNTNTLDMTDDELPPRTSSTYVRDTTSPTSETSPPLPANGIPNNISSNRGKVTFAEELRDEQ